MQRSSNLVGSFELPSLDDKDDLTVDMYEDGTYLIVKKGLVTLHGHWRVIDGKPYFARSEANKPLSMLKWFGFKPELNVQIMTIYTNWLAARTLLIPEEITKGDDLVEKLEGNPDWMLSVYKSS